MTGARRRRTPTVVAVTTVAAVLVGGSAAVASTPDAGEDPHAEAVAEMTEELDAERAELEAVTTTDAMRADATFDLRADDASFPLDAEDPTTTLEQKQEEKDDTVVTLTSDLLFDFGEASLTPEAEKAVAELAGEVPQDATVRVDGYTDSVGDEAFNQELSEERADAVADVLGAERSDLTLRVKGHGETDPVAENEVDGEDNPAGRALNRRVEVTYPTS